MLHAASVCPTSIDTCIVNIIRKSGQWERLCWQNFFFLLLLECSLCIQMIGQLNEPFVCVQAMRSQATRTVTSMAGYNDLSKLRIDHRSIVHALACIWYHFTATCQQYTCTHTHTDVQMQYHHTCPIINKYVYLPFIYRYQAHAHIWHDMILHFLSCSNLPLWVPTCTNNRKGH